jgi:hypothetical protein
VVVVAAKFRATAFRAFEGGNLDAAQKKKEALARRL